MSLAGEYNYQVARIKVVGVGGAGGNIVNCMVASNVEGVKFITSDTKNMEEIEGGLKGADVVFITAGMGAVQAPVQRLLSLKSQRSLERL